MVSSFSLAEETTDAKIMDMKGKKTYIKILVFIFFTLLTFQCCSSENTAPSPTVDGLTEFRSEANPDLEDAICQSHQLYCSPDGRSILRCDPATGEEEIVETCSEGSWCIDSQCRVVNCNPGERKCYNNDTAMVCADDGRDWQYQPCDANQKCNEESGTCEFPCLLRVFVLIDQSGSMGGDTHPTKWEQAREAMSMLMASDAAKDIEFGLGAFPTGENSCSTTNQVIYPIPEATEALIDSYFVTNSPGGSTPLWDAVKFHIADTTANLNDPAYSNFILLISDGADTCYENHCVDECGIFDIRCIERCEQQAQQDVINGLAETTAFLRDHLKIRTFVIGFGSGVNPDELQAIASNGGTVLGTWIQASNVSELSEAFNQILSEMWQCNPIMY